MKSRNVYLFSWGLICLSALLALTALVKAEDAKVMPDAVDIHLEEISKNIQKDLGDKSYTVKRSPIFEAAFAVQKSVATARADFFKLKMQDCGEVDCGNRMRQGIKTITGCKIPHDIEERIKLKGQKHNVKYGPKVTATDRKFDLRTMGAVTFIKNQANCGSCWIFATIAGTESSYLYQTKEKPETVNWAEQSVLDCGIDGGCDGGWPEDALKFIAENGVTDEKLNPYQARSTNSCNKNVKGTHFVKEYGYVGNSSGVPPVQAIKDAMLAHGTIICCVIVDDNFAAYGSGVFRGRNTNPNQVNHAIDLVGWDDDLNCWIMRNHWGDTWGEQGYMRIDYNSNLIGYGAMWCTAKVEIKPDPIPVPPIPPSPVTTLKPGIYNIPNGSTVNVPTLKP